MKVTMAEHPSAINEHQIGRNRCFTNMTSRRWPILRPDLTVQGKTKAGPQSEQQIKDLPLPSSALSGEDEHCLTDAFLAFRMNFVRLRSQFVG